MSDALDLLKKDWEKSDVKLPVYSETDIYKMIHQSSTSIVKWIVVVSILEILFWVFLSVWLRNKPSMKSHYELFDTFQFMTISEIISYLVIIFFMYKFIVNYKKINTSSSVNELMVNIVNTRKTVINYVKTIITLTIISVMVAFVIMMNYDKNLAEMVHQAEINGNLMIFYILTFLVFLVYTAIVIFFIWLFYKLIYGFFLKRLFKNYKELKTIEN